MVNVLSNAVKFTNEGYVSLHIKGDVIGDEKRVTLEIKVTDSGIGIKSEEFGKLFDDFIRLDTKRNRNIEGAGLGLAITKNLCVKMGGEITVASVYDEGSTFTITLPQRYEKYEAFAQVEKPELKRVLLYETRTIYTKDMVMALENLGVYCKSVSSNSAFLAELREGSYTHVFASSFLYDSAKRVMSRLEPGDTALILLSEYGESNALASDVHSIAMPAHAGAIANILNGRIHVLPYNESEIKTVRFIAPNARVLIVDDVKTNLIVTKGLLAPFQMVVDCAESGQAAIELIKANRYDLVFMDHMMPEMDGIEATAEIRAIGEQGGKYTQLPIVALTANAVLGVEDMFLQNGMDDYLTKPIDTAKLYAVLEKWIPQGKRKKYVEDTAASMKPDFEMDTIDTKVGLAMTGGGIENYKQVLETFYLDSEEKKIQINAAMEAEDLPLFTTYIHALKSAAASIGALELSEEAKKLEIAGRQEDISYIIDNIMPFIRRLSDVAEEIGQALPGVLGNYGAAAEEDGHELHGFLSTLKDALAEIRIDTIDSALNSLRTGRWTAGTQRKIRKIDQLVLLFEYEEASEIITVMLKPAVGHFVKQTHNKKTITF